MRSDERSFKVLAKGYELRLLRAFPDCRGFVAYVPNGTTKPGTFVAFLRRDKSFGGVHTAMWKADEEPDETTIGEGLAASERDQAEAWNTYQKTTAAEIKRAKRARR